MNYKVIIKLPKIGYCEEYERVRIRGKKEIPWVGNVIKVGRRDEKYQVLFRKMPLVNDWERCGKCPTLWVEQIDR